MQARRPTSSSRDEVLRRIGRNLANFQCLEAALRSTILLLGRNLTPEALDTRNAALTRKHEKSSLGDLVELFAAEAFDTTSNTAALEPTESVPQASCRYTFAAEATPEDAKEHRRALLKLVRERNSLVHRDLLVVDLNSPVECGQLATRLDEQNNRIREHLEYLEMLRSTHQEALHAFVKYIQSEEFLAALRGQSDDA